MRSSYLTGDTLKISINLTSLVARDQSPSFSGKSELVQKAFAEKIMSLKRSPRLTNTAVAGLQSVQTLTSLAVPTFGKGAAPLLQNVPEYGEMDLEPTTPSPTLERKEIFRSEDWNSLQKAVTGLFDGRDPLLIPGELHRLHENVKNILLSKTGTFLSDYYKQELLAKGMCVLTDRLKNVKGYRLLQRMEEIWTLFFTKVLPTLEAVLYVVKPKGRLTLRKTTLAAFRDIVLFSVNIEGAVNEVLRSKNEIPSGIRHMLLVLQNVTDCYPPNKNKLRLESIVGKVIVPYLGFKGLYEGDSEPVIPSNEPILASRRRSSVDVGGPRRISRPFSVQPTQMDTLNQMFINAIRNKQDNQ